MEEAPQKSSKSKKIKEEKLLVTEPVVISTSITTTHVKDLHELCQSQVRMSPSFEFKAELPLGFSATLRLVGPEGIKEFQAEGAYPSKKHAKEAVAGLGLEYLRSLPKNSKSMMNESPEKDDTNWVGKLSDWCNSRKTRPEFTDYATPGAGFSCEIRLPAEPGYPGLEDEVFGDKNAAFKNKRSAKVAASKAAWIWLQKNSPAPSSNGSISGGTKKSGKLSKATGDVIYPKGSKPAAIVNLVCPRLGVNTPEYKFTPDPRTPGMYDVAAIIRRPNGPKDVMVGPLKNLYGKKKAREEMSAGVYNWIKKEAERQGVGIYEATDTDES
ncbi:hypothetical protein P167DRAFT_485045 [Morchella conica CCBAS932]|uniref:DRBM domain-containing protein n=2 Tax=Morchella sect. Distantes TaxID=1051054 RepID=A0A3N4KUP1_9PEZI|nr:hypothetical protein P167DRAFT_485045 [Morchella conica CCBAS932]